MKNIKYIAAAMLGAIALTGCDKDGDTIYTTGPEASQISGNTGDIVLDYSNLEALALTLFWDENGHLSTSDPRVDAPCDAVVNVVQLGADPDFNTCVELTVDRGATQRQFVCSELNNLLVRIGFEGGVKAPLYVRVKSTIGSNVEPVYSNTLCVNVTPYVIDMTVGKFLNTGKEETGRTLYSENSDHVYRGFIGAGGWENWYLGEGNGVLLGNENADWYAFKLGSTETNNCGNMWYPGISGCYYTVVDGVKMEWSALLVTNLTVGGDLAGAMEYDRKANHWTLPVTVAAGTVNVTVSGNGKQYNVATGTADDQAIDCTVAFGGEASHLSFAIDGAATSIALTAESAGTATLVLELADPACWTLRLETGEVDGGETIDKYLWLTGVDDGITGSWGYDNYLINYNEDSPLYGGVVEVNSLWGYLFMKQATWGDGYGFDSGDSLEGTLNTQTSSNIPAPEAGIYLFDVSLAGMTYKLTPVASVSYTGLNDDWSVKPMERVSGTVYTATVEKTAETPWGVKILINESWDLYFGGAPTPGELMLYKDGFTGDNELTPGTYTLTVDLGKGTYKYE